MTFEQFKCYVKLGILATVKKNFKTTIYKLDRVAKFFLAKMPTYFPYKIIYDSLKPHPFKVQIYFYRAHFLNNMKSSNCRGRSIRNKNNGLRTGQVLQSLSQLINSVVENNSYSMCYSAKSKKRSYSICQSS